MTADDLAEAFAMIDALHAARLAAAPALALLVAHGAERGIDQAEIRRAVMLPAGVCKWLESPAPPMCDTIRDELQQPPLPAPDADELAALILRWCLT
jgi:hypothetical protein